MKETQDMRTERAKLFEYLHQVIKDERTLRAMERVPRELFVPSTSQHMAYEDRPLPIEMGQTISQPYMVALMTEALGLRGHERVLEVGTGSGYQTAILAGLARLVVSVERHLRLVNQARRTLQRLGYRNIEVHLAETAIGWREGAPYDGIIVTAGAPRVPQELLDQLAEDGRLVIPVGSRHEQQLLKVSKHKGEIATHDLGGCRFVPLIAKSAWEHE